MSAGISAKAGSLHPRMFGNARIATVNRRLNGSVAHQLAILIITGRLRPGEILPNEDELSASLAVSRTAYREGVRTLVAKGLVETRPKVGTKVAMRPGWNLLDPDVLAWHLEAEPDPAFIVSLFEIRKIVEPAAAALAAERREDADIAVLTDALRTFDSIKMGSIEGLEADLVFHRGILQATRNEALVTLSSAVEATMRWSVRLTLSTFPAAHQDSLPDHKAVLAAIVDRDVPAAEARMRVLVTTALENTLLSLAAAGL